MRCAWESYVNLLPIWMRQQVNIQGKDTLQELRMRLGQPPELVTQTGSEWLPRVISMDDLNFTINAASRYSPWAAATISQGYITAPGGHRLGLCGSSVEKDKTMHGIHMPTSICLRVARDFPGIAKAAANVHGSILILGKPGSGKTTLLRDLIRQKSDNGSGSVAVVDERGELFPYVQERICFPPGKRTDILTGCRKTQGIEAVLRSMGPETIAVDEITASEDCEAMIHAGWCGVKLLATAHATDQKDLYSRHVYKPLTASKLFSTLLILQSDKSWRLERMNV